MSKKLRYRSSINLLSRDNFYMYIIYRFDVKWRFIMAFWVTKGISWISHSEVKKIG